MSLLELIRIKISDYIFFKRLERVGKKWKWSDMGYVKANFGTLPIKEEK